MKLSLADYQSEAEKTDKSEDNLVIPLLGLAGETGELLTEYKKHLREGDSHRMFKEKLEEELGDILWYLSNSASKFGLELDEVARKNLLKIRRRWGVDKDQLQLAYVCSFDGDYPENEQFPRKFEVKLTNLEKDGENRLKTYVDGIKTGDDLTDNSYVDDGYRFHDVFHFGYAAVLGWSPVARSIMGRKRKSQAKVDEVEDGGRAMAIEEGISAMVFSYASQHEFLDEVTQIDYEVLRTIRLMTTGLEVCRCSEGEWEQAIFEGFKVWRKIRDNAGGSFCVDLDQKRLEV